MSKQHIVFDTEIIGVEKPVFLVRCKIIETGEQFIFWHDKRGHTKKLAAMLADPKYTWIGFNSENFDRPLIAMAVMGHDEQNIKVVANNIIEHNMRSWQTYKEYDIDFLEYDHIDIMEVPKGVMLSLKIYEGRMHAPVMADMPFSHTTEIFNDKKRRAEVEVYCGNDISETERLFNTVRSEIDLRIELGEQYGVDIRSKSDAQCAEAILKKVCGIGRTDKVVPGSVRYKAPSFIKTKNPALLEIIAMCEEHKFKINFANGSPEFPEFLTEPIKIGTGVYQMGIGGLHSQHDKKLHIDVGLSDSLMLSDFDVASYYPNIMMKAGLIPKLGGNKGQLFLEAYEDIYEQRIAAKRAGDKGTAETLKIVLNGTFGKLGSIFCSFYAPELMLAVTITGQLNLLCLIDELVRLKGVTVESANTDGIMVKYPASMRHRGVLKKIQTNAKRTGFEYEETPYRKVAMKDVNNYYAVPNGSLAAVIDKNGIKESINKKLDVKRKGLYAKAGVHENKNPAMEVCSDAVAEWLRSGHSIEKWVNDETDIRKFVEIRNVAGGGVQHTHTVDVDDWIGEARNWRRPHWPDDKKSETRVSRPKPVSEGRGGVPFGRVARWYMTKDKLPPITYVKSGNKVPSTDGAKLCLTLPKTLPKDLDKQWYIDEAYRILADCGVETF